MAAGVAHGQPRQLDDELWVLDTMYRGEPGVIASYMLAGDDGLALIDVGSAGTVDQLVRSITETGRSPAEIRHIVLTHVHLDHAGATGSLLSIAPYAQVYVHPRGAPHLVDPSKLVASATRIYGDQMDVLWGTTLPVPQDRMIVLDDSASIVVGNRKLTALHTPGHAIHHIAYFDATHRALFAGDVAGVALEGSTYVRPPTPPPDLDIEVWKVSIARMRDLDLERLYLPHFGRVTRIGDHLTELETRLEQWGELVLAGMRAGHSTEQMTEELAQISAPEVRGSMGAADGALVRRYELATNYRMTIAGYERYWRKRHPERLG